MNTPFYLTGGTALSRHYFNFRYSDDLDFFVNNEPSYPDLVSAVFKELEGAVDSLSFRIDYDRLQRGRDYTYIPLHHHSGFDLSLDFINDVAPHFGGFEDDELLGRVDSWRNILSNKISALHRLEPKDVVDLWIISRYREFSWEEIFSEAKQKEAGSDPIMIFELLNSFPEQSLALIKWAQPIDPVLFLQDLNKIARDIFAGRPNSLCRR